MSNMNEKYNLVLHRLNGIKGECTDASVFSLEYDEFEIIIKELEKDGHINKGEWDSHDNYYSQGLTFTGKSFIEHNDSKEYHKREKIEIYNNLNIGINNGLAAAGNHNIINNSKFDQKFTQLLQEIKNSSIGDKNQIAQNLTDKKDDKEALQTFLGILLTRGSEVATIVPIIGALLGML